MEAVYWLMLYPFMVYEKARVALGIPMRIKLRHRLTEYNGSIVTFWLEQYCVDSKSWEQTRINVALERPPDWPTEEDIRYPIVCRTGTDESLMREVIDPGMLSAVPLWLILPIALLAMYLADRYYKRLEEKREMSRHMARTLDALAEELSVVDFELLRQSFKNATACG